MRRLAMLAMTASMVVACGHTPASTSSTSGRIAFSSDRLTYNDAIDGKPDWSD